MEGEMKSHFVTILSLVIVFQADADTTYVSGAVSGVWTITGNPYIATGSLVVQTGQELQIEPGVRVELHGGQRLTVYGRLHCEGSAADPVLFTQDTVTYPTRWQGLAFANSTGDSSVLRNAIVEFASSWDGVIRVMGGLHEIRDLNFRYNTGFGVNVLTQSLRIENSTFFENGREGGCGAAVRANSSQIEISGCTVKYSRALDGGALCFYDCEVTVDSTEFYGNKGTIWGGVVYADNSNFRFESCVFDSNLSLSGGVAHLVDGGKVEFNRCVFSRNESRHDGYTGNYGAVFAPTGDTLRFTNCLFYRNWGGNYSTVYSDANMTIHQCVFVENAIHGFMAGPDIDTLRFTAFHTRPTNLQGAPPNFGVLQNLNENGDSIDVYGNLFTSPGFDPLGPYGEFSLHHTSHLINAGSANSPQDPDGTLPDLGPYPFFHLAPIDDLNIVHITGTQNIRLRWTEVPDAVEYWVFRTTSGEFDWSTAQFVGANAFPEYVHEGALAEPFGQTTYVVIASQVSAQLASPLPTR